MPPDCQIPTNIVFNIADVEGGCRYRQTQAILLWDKDGLCKAIFFQILCC